MAQELSSSPRSVLFDGNLIGISWSSMHLPSPLSCKAGKHFFPFGQERGRRRALSSKRRPASPVSTHATPQPHVPCFTLSHTADCLLVEMQGKKTCLFAPSPTVKPQIPHLYSLLRAVCVLHVFRVIHHLPKY